METTVMEPVRENAESIALYRGEEEEESQVNERFGAAFNNFTRLINWQLVLYLFQYAYTFLTTVRRSTVNSPIVRHVTVA